jgi:hypothetical protein
MRVERAMPQLFRLRGIRWGPLDLERPAEVDVIICGGRCAICGPRAAVSPAGAIPPAGGGPVVPV